MPSSAYIRADGKLRWPESGAWRVAAPQFSDGPNYAFWSARSMVIRLHHGLASEMAGTELFPAMVDDQFLRLPYGLWSEGCDWRRTKVILRMLRQPLILPIEQAAQVGTYRGAHHIEVWTPEAAFQELFAHLPSTSPDDLLLPPLSKHQLIRSLEPLISELRNAVTGELGDIVDRRLQPVLDELRSESPNRSRILSMFLWVVNAIGVALAVNIASSALWEYRTSLLSQLEHIFRVLL